MIAEPVVVQPAYPRYVIPLLIAVVVVLCYGISPMRLPLIGEEACRARHGIEMVQTGDWIIATNQGVPRLDRPPGQYWVLAIVHKWVHALDPLTLRLFMMVIMLVTSLMIWFYSRRFFSEAGAFVAAVAYPTIGHVHDLGRLAETDGQFTLLLAASLLVWHFGYEQRWGPAATWTSAIVLAALATLTKGTQAPVAFFGTVYLFLLFRRDRRFVLHWSHFTSLALYVLLIAIWQVPFYLQAGWVGTRESWFDPGTSRLSLESLIGQLATFPLEALVAALPWSFLLIALFASGFWRLDDKARSSVVFMLIGMASIFVPVWISVGGEPRYIMPMYPLMAVVCGAVAQQCLASAESGYLRRLWSGYLRGLVLLLSAGVLLLLVAAIAARLSDPDWARRLAQSWWLLAVLVVTGAVAAGVVFRGPADPMRRPIVQTFVVAAFLAVFFNGPMLNISAYGSARVGPGVQEVRERIPADARLVSFGPLHQKFIFFYEEPIPIVTLPATADDVPEDLQYFALSATGDDPVHLPFAWEELARLNMDPKRTPSPMVVVGRRVR